MISQIIQDLFIIKYLFPIVTMPYTESKQFWRQPNQPPKMVDIYASDPDIQNRLLSHIQKSVPQGNLQSAISQCDKFAQKDWLMSLGPQKAVIIKNYVQFKQIKNVLEIGGYCGYSALVFAQLLPEAKIHTIQINEHYAGIANKIQKIAGVSDRIFIHLGTVTTLEQQIKKNGPYDLILVDHVKNLYLEDFQKLQKYGVVRKGTIVLGDNMINPGSPDYLAHFKQNSDYDSILEHTYVQYCDIPDAILISQRITQN